MLSRQECWARVSELMHRETGVLLQEDQAYLLESRVQPIAQIQKYASLESFVESACSVAASGRVRMALVDAMTTHESYFFRDSFFWGSLQTEVLRQFKAEGRRKLRVWSAACSYGQEAYSLAMLLKESDPELLRNTEIFASDVSEAALERARKGVYSTVEVNRGLTAPRLIKHFDKSPGGFSIKEDLRRVIQWRAENLLQVAHKALPFDIILCRNVLIYFDNKDRQVALSNLLGSTTEGGYIGLGTSETLLKPQVAPGWYRYTRAKENGEPYDKSK
ncbi:MAG: protein-glutamate O-methyltransferase CheR [Cytophagaceae bacterium]|nr:MAG: protein-glutamate O-methyltransferase CheR [Cytophagaceae bacterium]